MNVTNRPVLVKPFNLDDLRQLVCRLLAVTRILVGDDDDDLHAA